MAFLLLAIGLSIAGVTLVVLRHRNPTSMHASIDEFERGLRAIAPTPPDPPYGTTDRGARSPG
ncbi:MAG: hypothetical protein M5U14_14205 [Acidimicrobiia bacterium]|nr:hypothetical protein [Acidimicrobiia bacterium]